MSKVVTRWATLLATGFAVLLLASATARAEYFKKQPTVSADVSLRCQQYVNKMYPSSTGAADREREAQFRACIRKGDKR